MAYYEHYFVEPNRSSGVNDIELQVLIDLARQKSFRWYVEVGVWRLGTLCAVAEATSAKLRCIGIDAFGNLPRDINGSNSHQGDVVRLSEALQLLIDHGLNDRVKLIQGDSSVILPGVLAAIREEPKAVFIDGNHTYEGCQADFRVIDPYLAAKDFLVFHDALHNQHPDYGRGPRGVIEDELLASPHYVTVRMPTADTRLSRLSNSLAIFERIS